MLAVPLLQILDPSNVKRIVEEADGYQPHLIAPEMGYRRLLQECLVLFKGPADTAVGEVHHVLRSIVASTINSEDCKNLQQYTSLKREIVTTASSSLGKQCYASVASLCIFCCGLFFPCTVQLGRQHWGQQDL